MKAMFRLLRLDSKMGEWEKHQLNVASAIDIDSDEDPGVDDYLHLLDDAFWLMQELIFSRKHLRRS